MRLAADEIGAVKVAGRPDIAGASPRYVFEYSGSLTRFRRGYFHKPLTIPTGGEGSAIAKPYRPDCIGSYRSDAQKFALRLFGLWRMKDVPCRKFGKPPCARQAACR